ncbi:2OG-Fe(II) oxygenase [Altericroceibacterium xinjiangense]|uniref:2OG-Fe(II) oxygenase n=1 Tax=Altericroceibacterium xinjiangense TaxID=762261 RepID=UPI000F7E022C|nr:2OG-Fe(II) oxygenase [Altericroceibacterium xinjiangense]
MSFLSMTDLGGYRCFDFEDCQAAGGAMATRYRDNDPFPHIVLDDFLDPDLLRRVVVEFPDSRGRQFFDRAQERLKFQFRPDQCPGPSTRMLFAELNSRAFLAFLSEMTGIKGLIADPYHAGAGLHETRKGGHLGIHADFPHHGGMKVERRLNLLIYLNEDWAPEYGGALELWDRSMQRACHSILPEFGRAVIFNTDRDTFHGHPDPLSCPDTRARRSIATYYYTASATVMPALERTTDFRTRPGSDDRSDWSVKLHNLKADWIPPVLQRRWGN